MRVIAAVGLPGSGKSEAAAVAESMGIPVVSMGDVIREETADRGLDPRADHGAVATALRKEEGPGAVAERSIPIIEGHLEDADVVFVDGIRSDAEVERFREAFGDGFVLLSIEAPFETRASRLEDRGRDATTEAGGEALADRDERELGFGMGRAMDDADVVIENTDSLEAFREAIRTHLERER